MLKLSKLTDYGTLVMTMMAVQPETMRTAAELAARTHLGAATVSKLLKQLNRGELLESVRGPHGGYRLARAPEKITVADIVSVFEGPIGITECSVHSGGCGIESSCGARTNWRLINTAIRHALEAVTLAEMAAPMQRLAQNRSRSQIPNTVPLSQVGARSRSAAGKA